MSIDALRRKRRSTRVAVAIEPTTVSYLNGLLVLRFLFGFADTALVAGAVDTVDCMRCDETTIDPYLSGLD